MNEETGSENLSNFWEIIKFVSGWAQIQICKELTLTDKKIIYIITK